MPPGYLVPEGFDDCVVEFPDRRVWIQIKSRKDTPFRKTEIRDMLDSINAKTAMLPKAAGIRVAIVLEQPRNNNDEVGIARIFDDETGCVFVSRTPAEDAIQLLSAQLKVAEIVADGLVSDLYRLVADASAENASLSFGERRRISLTEVERHIFERLEAEDLSVIEHALRSGVLEPVDFTTPVNDLDFYRGVKVKPGHIAANLVLDRPSDVSKVLDTLRRQRHVLVSGPSGAGKSALVWLATAATADQKRWYQIAGMATTTDAKAIIQFVRSRQPSEHSPLGLIFDEIISTNIDLWNALAHELRSLPDLYFLGSVRQEDVHLVVNRSDTGFFPVSLGKPLARAIWEELAARNSTDWGHWREPFEQSDGLMLEYVHLLTQGGHLATVIGDQIRQRERENRNDELKIVRGAAVLCAQGGEVDASRLFDLLDLTPDAANLALKRLIDEHLVRESCPGLLGGLHMLRSDALVEASHDGIVFDPADTLWRTLPATTTETLPTVVRSVLASFGDDSEPHLLRKLADILGNSCDIDQQTGILTGLGLATLDRRVSSFISILDRYGLQRAHWSLASLFADPLLEVSDLPASDQWTRLRKAILAFRTSPKHDLRAACLEHLPPGSTPFHPDNISQANKLLSSLVPICGGDPIRISFCHEFLNNHKPNIRQLARLLSTVHLIDQDFAQSLVKTLGGEQVLFDLFCSQVPWTTPPKIEPKGEHGRTVRSNWYQVAECYQPDPHDMVCEICEILIALSPRSDAAASDVIDPTGRAISIADYQPWSKNMPRKNLPAKAHVAWNVAFRQILLARSTVDSLTNYTKEMAKILHATEKIFRFITEKWIKRKHISNTDALASKINSIHERINELAYVTPERAPSSMMDPLTIKAPDSLGIMLTGVLNNLVGRLYKPDTAKSAATFAGSLHDQAYVHRQSTIWRTMSSPPMTDLKKISDRLSDVSCILHEMAHGSRPDAIQDIAKIARKASTGNAVHAAAHHCRLRARSRFDHHLRELENALASHGWQVRCLSRPNDQSDSPYWPAREVAVVVEIEDINLQWLPKIEEILSIVAKHLDNNWLFTAVPVMNGQILASLAVLSTSYMPLHDQAFARKWADFIDQPIYSSLFMEQFKKATDACIQISAIVNSRGVQDLHPDENEVLSRAFEAFNNNRERVESAANQADTEYCALALDHLNLSGDRLRDEIESAESGQTVAAPLCMAPYLALAGQPSEHMADITAICLALIEVECRKLVAVRDTRKTDGAIDNNNA